MKIEQTEEKPTFKPYKLVIETQKEHDCIKASVTEYYSTSNGVCTNYYKGVAKDFYELILASEPF